jgi:hypothetical protein
MQRNLYRKTKPLIAQTGRVPSEFRVRSTVDIEGELEARAFILSRRSESHIASAARDEFEVGQAAANHLGRYFSLLHSELATVQFSLNELRFLADVIGNSLKDPIHTMPLAIGVNTALDSTEAEWDYQREWNVDGLALYEKVLALSTAQQWAVVDALERAWEPMSDWNDEEFWRKLGLLR